MENGAQIDTINTDLKAAFDRVDHNLLLAKVERMGATPNFVNWLKSYLVDRRLTVKIGAAQSSYFSNCSGVPQGSNLGPLLFSLFYNDVCAVLPRGCRLLYADDLKIYLIVSSVEDCQELQRLVDVFTEWCGINELTISTNKCSVISFTRKKNPIIWNYNIGGEQVERVSTIKDLGVHLDTKLSFREHYSFVIAKANRNLGFIFRISNEFRDPYCLRALYYSLVRSVLEYAAVVWSPYTSIWTSRIEAVQSRFIRYALRFLPWRDPTNLPPYQNRCRLLGMDTLSRRRQLERVLFVQKVLTGSIDSPSILAQININVVPRSLRHTDFLRLDFRRTEYGQNEPLRVMCFMFNSVYSLFDFSVSSNSFRQRLLRSNVFV